MASAVYDAPQLIKGVQTHEDKLLRMKHRMIMAILRRLLGYKPFIGI